MKNQKINATKIPKFMYLGLLTMTISLTGCYENIGKIVKTEQHEIKITQVTKTSYGKYNVAFLDLSSGIKTSKNFKRCKNLENLNLDKTYMVDVETVEYGPRKTEQHYKKLRNTFCSK